MSTQPKSNRRRFLKIAGGTILTTAAIGGGLIALGSRQPHVDMPETNLPGQTANAPKVLVAYASVCGSTADVAATIGKTLNTNGFAVDVRLAQNVTDLTPYQAVIVGSAIRMGNWLAAATNFVKTQQAALRTRPTAYVVVCTSLIKDGVETEATRRVAASYLEPVRAMIPPVAEGLFAGKMDYSKLSAIDRLIITRLIKAPAGDWRNWEAIRTWAANLPIGGNVS